MNDFLNIDFENDSKLVGTFPQVYELESDKESSQIDLVKYIGQKRNLPIETYSILKLQADPLAKLTDVLSCTLLSSYWGLLISPKLFNLLEKFNLPPFNVLKVEIRHKDNIFHYCWLHFSSNINDIVDYPRSEFVIYDPRVGAQPVSLSSYEEFVSVSNGLLGLSRIISRKIILDRSDLDFFKLSVSFRGYFASKRLYAAMQKENISGFSLIKLDS